MKIQDADPRLGGAERDGLDARDLLGGEPVEDRQDDRLALLGR